MAMSEAAAAAGIDPVGRMRSRWRAHARDVLVALPERHAQWHRMFRTCLPPGRWQRGCAVIAISLSASAASAAPPGPIAACLDAAARHHRVDPRLLRAIAAVESGFDATAIGAPNRDGSHDIGLMQVNSRWLPRLARFGIDARRLREPCVSAYVGAWILAGNIRRHGPVWRAVGAYNARSPERQASYVRKVVRELARQSGGAAP